MELKLNFIGLLETDDPSKISIASGTDIIAAVTSLFLGMIVIED